jgi:hypothetical protein
MFIVRALRGGFLAEGFFLLVIGWVVFLVVVAKIASRLRRRGQKTEDEWK